MQINAYQPNPQTPAINTYPANQSSGAPTETLSIEPAVPVPNQDLPPLESTGTLGEISSQAPVITPGDEYQSDTASLSSDSGSGNIPAQIATTLYVLNHSFDIQKQMIDLLI